MSRHTFPLVGGRRLVICPCKFHAGNIRLEIQSSQREIMGSVTLDGPTLALVSQAMEIEALAALSRDAKAIEVPLPVIEVDQAAYRLDAIRTNEIFGGLL